MEGKNQIERLRVELMRSSKRESETFKEQKEMSKQKEMSNMTQIRIICKDRMGQM